MKHLKADVRTSPESKSELSPQEQAQVCPWIQARQRLGPILERVRREAVRGADPAAATEAFELAYRSARRRCPPRARCGLVEQPRWFKREHQ